VIQEGGGLTIRREELHSGQVGSRKLWKEEGMNKGIVSKEGGR
jgi:hypothetical protein